MVRPALFAPLLFFSVSCGLLNEDNGNYDPNVGRVSFRVTEGHYFYDAVKDPEIGLTMRTEKIYGCINYSIVHQVERSGNIISVRLQSIYIPEICLTAIGPASGYSTLDLTPGSYRLKFISGTAIDEFQLNVTDTSLTVTGSDTAFAVPSERMAWRLPRRSFVYLCGSMTTNTWVCSDFLDTLRLSGRFTEITIPDTGWSPYPRSPDGYWFNSPAHYFRYATEADFDSAGAMLTRYVAARLRSEQGIGLSLLNWRNKHFYSWMM
jgi:hypothetical protein